MKKRKTLVIGLDGLDWQLLNPLMDQGFLPALRRLKERGVYGNINTLNPTLSPILWNSIATGKRAYAHGIHGFTEVDEETQTIRPASSLSRNCKALWNIFQQNGYESHVINWFASHPAEPLNGSMISDLFPEGGVPMDQPWPLKKGTIHPEGLNESLLDCRVSFDEIPPEIIQTFVPKASEVKGEDNRLLRMTKELAKAYTVHNATTWIMENESWDFLAAYWRTPDILFHYFMPYHPPAIAGVGEKDMELYGKVVTEVCGYFDLFLQTYLRLVDDETNILIVSDHGFQSGALRPHFNENPFSNPEAWHRPQGVFLLSGPGIRKNEEIFGARLTDVAPTLLAVNGIPAGADMAGRVLSEVFETVPDLRSVPTWETIEGDTGQHLPGTKMEHEDAQQLIQQFVDLGYIDPLDNDKTKAIENTHRLNQFHLAEDSIDAKKPGLALPLLEELHFKAPENPDYCHMLATCQRHLGLIREAEATMARLVERLKPGPRLTFLKARLAFDRKEMAEGLALLEEVKAIDTNYPGLYLALGRVYNELGRYDEAEKAFQRVFEVDSDNAVAHQGMAYIYLRRRNYEMVIDEGIKAIGLKFDLPMAHFYLGLAFERMEFPKEARQAFEASLVYYPHFAGAHRALIRLYRKDGELEKAKGHEARLESLKALRDQGNQRLEMIREASAERLVERQAKAATETRTSVSKKVEPKDILIVSGMPRSGTSVMMQMLHAAGIEILKDNERVSDANNPKGYFEWQRIKKLRQQPDLIDEADGKAVKVISMLLPYLPVGHRYKIIYMDRDLSEIAASQERMLQRMNPSRGASNVDNALDQMRGHRKKTKLLLSKIEGAEVLEICFADLFSDPGLVVDRVIPFLGEMARAQREAMLACVEKDLYRERKV